MIKLKYISISIVVLLSLLMMYRGIDYLYSRYESKKILSQKDMSLYEYEDIKKVVDIVLSSYTIDNINGEGVRAKVRSRVSDNVWEELFPSERDNSSVFTSYAITNYGVYKKDRDINKVLVDVTFKNDVNSYDVRLYMTIKGGIVTNIESLGVKSNGL